MKRSQPAPVRAPSTDGARVHESLRMHDLLVRQHATERDVRSQRFNSLQPGDAVVITSNHRPSFHDVTGRRSDLDNQASSPAARC